VNAVCEVTGVTPERAAELLQAAGRTFAIDPVTRALELHFDGGQLSNAEVNAEANAEANADDGEGEEESRTEREARLALIREQDEQFEQSMREDARRMEEKEAMEADVRRESEKESERLDAAKAQMDEKRHRETEAQRDMVHGGEGAVAHFRVRMPDGRARTVRPFDVREPVVALFDALDVRMEEEDPTYAHPPGSYALAVQFASVLDGHERRHFYDGDVTSLLDAGLIGSTALFMVPRD